MSEKQVELYKAIQIEAGAVGYDLRFCRNKIVRSDLDDQTKDAMLDVCDSLLSTTKDLATLISKTAQLIFEK